MSTRFVYQIVRIGVLPGNDSFAMEGATCEQWSRLDDKADKEVIAVDIATGKVSHRYPHEESESIARNWRNPTVR